MQPNSGYPQIARGPRAAWDFEHQARRAVEEEEAERARMQAEVGTQHGAPDAQDANGRSPAGPEADVYGQSVPEPPVQALSGRDTSGIDRSREIDLLAQDRAELLAKVVQQAEMLGRMRAEMDALRQSSAIANGVVADLMGSRGYFMMRLFGRWRSLERSIQRALRQRM